MTTSILANLDDDDLIAQMHDDLVERDVAAAAAAGTIDIEPDGDGWGDRARH